jgi:hypothetical protein
MTQKVVAGVVLGTAAIVATPFIVPAASIPSVSAAIAATKAAALYLVPSTTVGKVGIGLTAAQMARPYVTQTAQEELDARLKAKAALPYETKSELIECFKANKSNAQRNAAGRPPACEDAALAFAFTAGMDALAQKTQLF